jgi:outer membrane protein
MSQFLAICSLSYAQVSLKIPGLDASKSSSTGRSLEDFFTAAINNSPKLQIANEGIKIGTARRNNVNSQLLPQVRASANLSNNKRNFNQQRQEFDGNRYSLQLTQTLFNWQAFAERSQAYIREDIAQVDYYNQLSSLLTEVASKYFDVLQARDALDSITSELEAVTNQLSQIEQLYSRQLTQITDLYQTQANVAAVESQRVQLQSQFTLARDRLRSISGIETGNLYLLSEAANIPKVQTDLHYWVSEAEKNNHDVRSKELSAEEAAKGVSSRKGAYLPKVSLIAQRQDSDVGFDNMPMARTDNTFIGLDISVPIYSSGSNRALVREAKSLEQIALNDLRQTRLDVGERVRAAYFEVKASDSIISAAEKRLEFSTLNTEAMQRGFELRAVTSVDLLNALRDQYQAERDLQRVRYENIKSLLVLKREAGILKADDLIEVSGWLTP